MEKENAHPDQDLLLILHALVQQQYPDATITQLGDEFEISNGGSAEEALAFIATARLIYNEIQHGEREEKSPPRWKFWRW